jgi:TonB family protein
VFAQIASETFSRRHGWRVASLAIHGLLLAWLLHAPEPQLLSPVSIVLGENGRVVSRLYFPSQSPDDSSTNSSDRAREVYRHQRLGHQKLALKPGEQPANSRSQLPANTVEAEDQAQTLSSLGHGALAGIPYGTLSRGPTFGDEVRPALPVTTVDPVTYPWELPEAEGNVVVEVTIDERGEIVGKTILRSMGPKLDGKVLAALENWHFHPATRNGVAIASRQDVVYHFKPRG